MFPTFILTCQDSKLPITFYSWHSVFKVTIFYFLRLNNVICCLDIICLSTDYSSSDKIVIHGFMITLSIIYLWSVNAEFMIPALILAIFLELRVDSEHWDSPIWAIGVQDNCF